MAHGPPQQGRDDARVGEAVEALAQTTATALTVAAEGGARVDRILALLYDPIASSPSATTRQVTATFSKLN